MRFTVTFHRRVHVPLSGTGFRSDCTVEAEDHAAAHNAALDLVPGLTHDNIATIEES